MDSVDTVIRFRQSPPEGDITSVTISIVLDVFTGYIVKNESGWWYTWVWEGDSTHFQWGKNYECLQWLHPEEWEYLGGGGGGGGGGGELVTGICP